MPPRKKKVATAKTKRISIIETKEVPLRSLQVYHKNPRIGNVDAIAKSLHLNGLYRPIVVNVGTHTGREYEILAGNHTYLAARKALFWTVGKGDQQVPYDKPVWDTILVSLVDVDDEQAAAIVLADNKTSDDGRYDESVLADLFKDLPEVTGTGYTDDEVQNILAKFEEPISDADMPSLGDVIDGADLDTIDTAPPSRPDFNETDIGDEAEADNGPTAADLAKRRKVEEPDEDDPEGAGVEITQVSDEIKGAYDLKDEMFFDSVGYWQIPRLRKDMLMTPDELPDNLTTWAGSATRHEDDPDTWWLYNYGVDSTSGMKDISKVILAFYTYDEYFEPWWWSPSKYTAKIINSGIKYAITPDFSDDTLQGRAFCMYQLYRARWMARYLQEAGVKIIPNLSWPHGDIEYLERFTLPTLPKDIPMAAVQLQTFNKAVEEEEKDKAAAELQLAMDTVKPDTLIVYAGQPGYEFFQNRIKYDGNVRFLLNRQAKLSASRKGRAKKDTI